MPGKLEASPYQRTQAYILGLDKGDKFTSRDIKSALTEKEAKYVSTVIAGLIKSKKVGRTKETKEAYNVYIKLTGKEGGAQTVQTKEDPKTEAEPQPKPTIKDLITDIKDMAHERGNVLVDLLDQEMEFFDQVAEVLGGLAETATSEKQGGALDYYEKLVKSLQSDKDELQKQIEKLQKQRDDYYKQWSDQQARLQELEMQINKLHNKPPIHVIYRSGRDGSSEGESDPESDQGGEK